MVNLFETVGSEVIFRIFFYVRAHFLLAPRPPCVPHPHRWSTNLDGKTSRRQYRISILNFFWLERVVQQRLNKHLLSLTPMLVFYMILDLLLLLLHFRSSVSIILFIMETQSRQLHLFFFPLMAQGHMIPMTDIARLFCLRGHKSSIITTPFYASNISTKINRYKNSGLDINIVAISFPAEEVGLPKGCDSIDFITSNDMTGKFFYGTTLFQPQFEKLVAEMHPDCIVSDMFLPWTCDVALKHGIPRVVFHGTSFFSLCLKDNLKHHPPQESDGETFVVQGLPDEIKMKKSQMPKREVVESNTRFIELMSRIEESEAKSYGVLVNSFYELEPAYADHYRQVVGRRAWHIGPVSLSNNNIVDKTQRGKKVSVNEHYVLNWLDSKKHSSVIYISFGSVSCFSCSQLTEIAEGLEASGVPFIWVVRKSKEDMEKQFLPEGFEERMEGKGLVIRDWAPQVLILDHSAIGGFMTHCGWNSIIEGISAGVPLITWPLFAEQFHNEALITQVLKIGIKVGVEKWNSWAVPVNNSVTMETVESVVSQLFRNGEEMRNRTTELKEMAKNAMEEGGSSHADLTALIQELQTNCSIGEEVEKE